MRYDLVNPSDGLVPLPLEKTSAAIIIALEFDIKNNCLYWSDINKNKIMVSGLKKIILLYFVCICKYIKLLQKFSIIEAILITETMF